MNFLSDSSLVPLAISMIAIFLLMRSLRRKQASSATSRMRPGSGDAGSVFRQPDPAVRRDMDALLVELQELSRKISADIDLRFAKLEAVIADADRRIAALKRLVDEADRSTTQGSSPSKLDATVPTPEDRYGIVYELADQGKSPIDIARDLGKTPGEVELILNLRKQASHAAPPSAAG